MLTTPDELRRFGCELDLVTAADALMRATGMTRHLLRATRAARAACRPTTSTTRPPRRRGGTSA